MNHTNEQAQKAVKYFESMGVPASTIVDASSVKIQVNGMWVFISGSEIEFRAEMWDDMQDESESDERFICSNCGGGFKREQMIFNENNDNDFCKSCA